MANLFPDRTDRLFGREADIQFLSDRAGISGMTTVVARPLMGKTWTLMEVARRLTDEGQYLVGYHESTAAENSHLLYTVSNLYSRWLSDSSMRAQAISLWQRHKHDLVPRVGQMVSTLFETLSGDQLPEGVGAIVRSAFDGLALAQKDLLSGGIQIARLPYDQALSLTKLVATVSNRRVLLILDAWEKSSIRDESATLEAFLKHIDDWPSTHVFLSIRDPEMGSAQADGEANRYARDLSRLHPAAEMYDLSPLNLIDVQQRARVVTFVRKNVPAAEQVDEGTLLQMIDNYPGVLYFWSDAAKRADLRTEADLRQEANNAHACRYPEFDRLLTHLTGDLRTFAVRLALFPRLDAEQWNTLGPLLMKDLSSDPTNELIDTNVLIDDDVPTYGHDTRHTAARRWFVANKRPLARRTVEELVKTLASKIEGVSSKDGLLLGALNVYLDMVKSIQSSSTAQVLVDAASSTFGELGGISRPTFDVEYPAILQSNGLFTPLIVTALLVRSEQKVKCGDYIGAIADCTDVIKLPGAASEQLSKALLIRGVSNQHQGNIDDAVADFTAVIKLPRALAEAVVCAHLNLGEEKIHSNNYDDAIANFTIVVESRDVTPPEVVGRAYSGRGRANGENGESVKEFADYTAAIELAGAPPYVVGTAQINRGVSYEKRGKFVEAIADYTAVIKLPGALPDQIVHALLKRCLAKRFQNDMGGTRDDFIMALNHPALAGAPPELIYAAASAVFGNYHHCVASRVQPTNSE